MSIPQIVLAELTLFTNLQTAQLGSGFGVLYVRHLGMVHALPERKYGDLHAVQMAEVEVDVT
jgi:hypothetical protein